MEALAPARALAPSLPKNQQLLTEPSRNPGPKESIDLGLAVAAAVRGPGQCFSIDDLADICECSPQRISQLQARALRNLRRALERSGINWQAAMRELRTGASDEYRTPGLKLPAQ